MGDSYNRDRLSSRVIPHMTLAQDENGSTTTCLSSMPSLYSALPPRDSPAGRFLLAGNAVITGGTGNIALVIARALLQHGLSGLLLVDLHVDTPPALSALAALRREFPRTQILALAVDVTDEPAVASAFSHAVSTLGSLDMLICLAGIVHTTHALDHSAASFRRVMDVNATGTFIAAQAAARIMARQGTGGRIVMTASISAHRVNYPQPQVGYNASKGALLMMRASLAAEWARYGVTVNSLSPGYMDTVLNEGEGLEGARRTWCQRNPMGRMGDAEEVAGVVVMLCSRAGSYITGADIVVDGGGMVF